MNSNYYIKVFSIGKSSLRPITLPFLFMLVCSTFVFGQENEKDAQTGFQFMSVNSDARAAGMAEAVTTAEGTPTGLFFNPAGIARLESNIAASFNMNQWIAGITHNSAAIVYSPQGGKYGVIGLSLMSVDYGTIQGTMVWPNAQGYIDTEEYSPSAFSIGFAYAKALSDKFAIGVHVKNASSALGQSTILDSDSSFVTTSNVANAMAVDFGTLFNTGMRNVKVGMSVKNFSEEIAYNNGEENFQLPLIFTMGVSMDIFEVIGKNTTQRLGFAFDATHPRSHREQLKFGFEYQPLNLVSLRTGYILNNDEDGFNFGLGIHYSGIAFDYAISPFGRFDNVQRLSLRVSL